ncbi:hypothetical protein D9613_010932 [Agrocybe pediades]|uniref:DUF6533 domain-containing protein n=1 Tax=Agrocybe pediades TaxID=84607 RepID=A0A8H4VMC0_9AGAR|nr:hypothetical protein D9613_010932 [Agrocybe pediades]
MPPPPGSPLSAGGGPPSIPPDALIKQKQGNAVTIWAIGAFCIFGWELLLCLPQEYQRIWKRPMNLSSVLYIANRYFGLLQLCFVVTLVADAWSPADCKHVFYFEPVGALISTVLSQMILGSRVYAIFSQNKIVGAVLSLTLLVEVVIGGISISTTSPPPITPGPPGSRPPCGAVMGPTGWLIAFWTIPLFYDALAFLLTAWMAYDFWRKELNVPLFHVIWRDGLLYFFAIFSMNLTNVVIFLTVPKTLRAINLTPTLIFEIVLSCRLVLNLRGTQGGTTSVPSNTLKWSTDKSKSNPSAPGILATHEQVRSYDSYPSHNADIKLEPVRKTGDKYGGADAKAVAPWSEWTE